MKAEVKEARRKLDSVGRRRERHRQADEKLQEDTAKVVKETEGVVSTSEQARRLKLNRSTVYEVYK